MSPMCSPWCSRHGNGRCLATAYWTFSSYGRLEGGESTLDLCYASPEKNSGVTASTSRHWRPHESSMWRWFHIAGKCNTGQGVVLPGCNGGLQSGGSALLVVGSSVLVSLLLCSLSMSGAALSTRFRGSCSWLGERKGSWMVGYTCVTVQDVLSQGILSSSTTCGISGCSEEALHVIAIRW